MDSNSSSNKRIAKNTIFLYIRSIFLLVITLYTSRVTLQVLGVEDYGIYHVVGGVVAMFSMLSSTLAAASQRFITYALGEKDEVQLKKVFSTCITLHIILGIIVIMLLEVLGVWFLNTKMNIPTVRLNTASYVMHFSIATFFVGVISVPYNAIIIAHEKMNAFAYISILEGLLKLGIVFLLTIISWDKLYLYAALHFVISIILRSIYSIYSTKHFKETQGISFRVDKPLFKEMFAFAGWNLLGEGSLVLRNQGMDILINLFFGVVLNAAKGISNQVQAAVNQLVDNFTVAIKPQLTKSIAQENFERANILINNGAKIAFTLTLIVAMPIILCANEILSIWLVDVPDYAQSMVVVSMIYLIVNGFSKLPIHAVLSYGNIKQFQLIQGGLKLLAMPVAFLLLRFGLGPLTTLWVNVLISAICLIPIVLFLRKQIGFNIKWFLKEVIIPCMSSFIFAYLLAYEFGILISSHILFLAPTSIILSVMFMWFIGINKKERSFILVQIRQKIKK